MKRMSVSLLVLLAGIGGVVGWLAELALASTGRAIILPPLTFALALAVIGGIIVSLAVPIRRFTRGKTAAPIDPFYATRVLVLAKASALAGSLLVGAGIGVLLYLLTRSVLPLGSVAPSVAMIVGAAVLLAGGLVAEYLCTIPPGSDHDDDDGTTIKVEP
ncbi:hypothetical protein BH09ACT3_BH09ACT3_04860 [soil metagenome]